MQGLVETFNTLLPGHDHRFCVRHLYKNLQQKVGGGDVLKELVWKCARASNAMMFAAVMDELKAFSEDAYTYLAAVDQQTWSRSGFSTRSKCDLLSNNISECFNKWILSARERNIIGMADLIRRQLMRRMQEKRENRTKFTSVICPRISDMIEKMKVDARRYGRPIYAGDGKYEVSYFEHTFTVNINTLECGCRIWQLSGIPCVHGLVALIHKKVTCFDNYVDPCYYVDTYFKAYAGVIEPIPDCSQWPKQTGLAVIEPPVWKQGAGRPKKARKKDLLEKAERIEKLKKKGTLSKVGIKQKCSNCLQEGHNKKKCTNNRVEKEKRTGKGGRPPREPSSSAAVNDSEEWRNPSRRGRPPLPSGRGGRGGGRGGDGSKRRQPRRSTNAAEHSQPSQPSQPESDPSQGAQAEYEPSQGPQAENEPSQGPQAENEPSQGAQTEYEPSQPPPQT